MRLKSNNHYYFFCIYLIKLMNDFLRNTFREMDVDAELESELYIILNSVMIGLEVIGKGYEINRDKVINSKARKVNPKVTTVQKIQSVSSLNKKDKRLRRMMTRKHTMHTCDFKEKHTTPLEDFRE